VILINFPLKLRGVLGDYFYVLSYEMKYVVVRALPGTTYVVHTQSNASPNSPSPKRPKYDTNTSSESSEEQTGNSQNVNYGKSYCNSLAVVNEYDFDDDVEGADEDELIIVVIAKQGGDQKRGKEMANKSANSGPVTQEVLPMKIASDNEGTEHVVPY
jgi:hypothetical protein